MNWQEVKVVDVPGTYVIAEIGVNHDGDLGRALEMVDAVAECGADAVKIQTFLAETLVKRDTPKAPYQLETTSSRESQFEMLRRLELSRNDHLLVMTRAQERGLDFLSTPYDRDSLDFLIGDMGVEQIKIASSDITNLPLLLEAGRSRRRLILSTGMSTMAEILRALNVIWFGARTTVGSTPSQAEIRAPLAAKAEEYLSSSVILMQCTSQYPAPVADANLRAIATIKEAFGIPVGYSDHTLGSTTAIMSVALGSVAYEKHFTLDRTLPGPDHSASMEPLEFRSLVAAIREAETALGGGLKAPSPVEFQNRHPMRKSLFAARAITAGELVTESDVDVMRPEIGQTPDLYWEWVGHAAPRSFAPGEPIDSDRQRSDDC
jgi:sialic acid synthase SpsE